MNTMVDPPHVPVLTDELIEHLKPQPGQKFVDFTFGAGGHTRALLFACPDITVFCLDRDPLAISYARELSISTSKCSLVVAKSYCAVIAPRRVSGPFVLRPMIFEELLFKQVLSARGRFSEALGLLVPMGCDLGTVDGVVMDLGVSSMQIDSSTRGFGFNTDAFLDMRMDSMPNSYGGEWKENKAALGPSAADVLNKLSAPHLAKIFRLYGEERFGRRIANAVVEYRSTLGPICTTTQLVDLVASVIGPLEQRCKIVDETSGSPLNRDVITRVFQALRIFVNDELNELCAGLEASHRLLRPGGRAAVISFHSLEDRLVKRAFTLSAGHVRGFAQRLADFSLTNNCLSHPCSENSFPLWRQIIGPLRPRSTEVLKNKRSRSAKLRIGEKVVEH